MASFMDMSLEDIIKRKKRENIRGKGKNPSGKKIKNDIPTLKKLPITDARNKIILKKRTQITDAREKLAQLAKQKDARLKLDLLRKKRAMVHAQNRHSLPNHGKPGRPAQRKEKTMFHIDPSRQVLSQPLSQSRLPLGRQLNTKRFLENRFIETRSFNKSSKPIMRTVKNDIDIIDEDDPMGEEHVPPPRMSSMNRKANLQLRIVARNDGIETRSSTAHRLATPDRDRSPPRPPSILKKRPMAALRNEKNDKAVKPALEFRIIVSNLRSSVTGGDIEELFGDVGGMVESRLVRPGTAEVIYKTMEDAQRAVDLYHNRQLDGQPMTCLLVTPRAPTTTVRNGSKSALISSNSNVEPDISTFYKVLFNKF